jgi:hypothetical protein
MKTAQSQVNVKELKNVISHIINTNKNIQAKGITPIALNVVGPAGLGKTSTIQQTALDMGFKKENIVKLSLSTLDEVGDLIGIPLEEYKMIKKVKKEGQPDEVKELWVKEAAINSYSKAGYVVTNKSRMTYSTPEWIEGKTGPGVLILDDYTRASQRFTQAVMELVLCQEYASWKLPEGWTILLSSNPDDGMYNVTDQDAAQKSRYMNVNLGWDATIWAEWAEKHGIDGRCINFVLLNKEIVKEETPEVNARSITLFFNAISSIKDFNSNLPMIQLLGEGSLGVEVTTMFTSFIHNKMDKLITPEEIFDTNKNFLEIEKSLRDLVKSGTEYRADIAYVLTTRMLNYIEFNIKDSQITNELLNRIEEIVLANCLGSDLKFVLGRRISNLNTKYNSLLMREAFVDTILE